VCVCVCVCVCVSVFLSVCYYFFSDCRIYLFSSLAARVFNKLTRSDRKMCLVFQKSQNIPEGRPLPLKSWLKLTHRLQEAVSSDTSCLVARQG